MDQDVIPIHTHTTAPKSNRIIVRLKTSMWTDRRGAYIKKTLTYLRRQCDGYNFLEDDLDAGGVNDVIPRILNMDECKDGLYEVTLCNEIRDYETGYIEDYDYRLLPLSPVTGGA